MPQQLPEDVQRLLRDQIRSIEQLEIILLLRENAERAWTPGEVYQQVRSSERSVAQALDRLCRLNLLARRDTPGLAYQFAPGTASLRETMERLAALYAERRVRIVEAIYSERGSEVDEFARAFRIRKEPPDG